MRMWLVTPAGHSLGGAVASLCALRLLRLLPKEQHHTVAVIGFASPAFGNAAVAAHVEAEGWSDRFTNYLLPGEGREEHRSTIQISLGLPVLGL